MALKTRVRLGDCVIINDVDGPYSANVAVVVGIDRDMIRTRYLNSDARFTMFNRVGCVNRRKDVTHIHDFGVILVVDGDKYWCDGHINKSIATYRDGTHRDWQESPPRKHRFRRDVLSATREELLATKESE